jgi:hypothetical protein
MKFASILVNSIIVLKNTLMISAALVAELVIALGAYVN